MNGDNGILKTEISTNEGIEGTVVKTSDELIEACFDAARIEPLKKAKFSDTTDLLREPHKPVGDAISLTSSQPKATILQSYTPVPQTISGQKVAPGSPIWRVELYGLGQGSGPLGFDIFDDAIVGRGSQAHINLDPYDAAHRGVSRRHALIRPTRARLYLIDLGSINGTFLNSVPLGHAATRSISHNDVISLGELSFALRIVDSPPDVAYHPRSSAAEL